MSPEHDDYEEEEEGEEFETDGDEPRSIFSATWFRALLLVIGLAVVAVLALPYVLEWLGPPPQPTVSILRPPPATPPKPSSSPKVVEPPRPSATTPAPSAPTGGEGPAQAAPKAVPPAAPTPPRPTVAKPPPATSMAKKPATPASKPAVVARGGARGEYWVQVGAFTAADNAARLATRLTEQNYRVERATVTRGGEEMRNEVFVPGAAQSEVYDAVKGKGYRADAVKGGAAVRPLLSLRDAVEISKELTEAGMDVRIRRVGEGKRTLHLVRVGAFSDRDTARAAQKELEGKGVRGFVIKGAPR